MVTKNKQLKNVLTLRAILLFGILSFLYLGFTSSGAISPSLLGVLIDSSYIVLVFAFLVTFLNISLVAREIKGKKVFDHLILIAFLFFVGLRIIFFLNNFNLNSDIYEAVTYLFNFVIMPLSLFALIIWSIRLITTKVEKLNPSIFIYYLFLTTVLIEVFYIIGSQLLVYGFFK